MESLKLVTSNFFKRCVGICAWITIFGDVDFASAQSGYRWVVEPQYDDAGSAFDGVVPILSGNKWGLMGANGTWHVPPSFDALGRASDGHIAVKIGDKWGIVDTDGNQAIPPVYQEIGQWADRIPVRTDQGWMVLDKEGRKVFGPLQIDKLRGNEGHCIAGQNGDQAVLFDDRTGIARNVDGPIVTSSGAMRLFGPTHGMVRYSVDGEFGFISCTWLRTVGERVYESARRVTTDGGYSAVRINGKWGLHRVWDTGIQEKIPPQYTGLRDYTESRLPVKLGNDKWGYLSARGELEIEAIFDQAYSFSDGIAGVQVGDKRGFILPDGTYAAEPMFEDFWRHSKGIAPVKLDGNWGVIAFEATAQSGSLDFDPAVLAVAEDQTGKKVRLSVPHKYFRQDYFNVQTIVMSDDGKLMATILDETEGENESWRSEIAIWDTQSKLALGRLLIPGAVQARFVGDGEIIAVGEVTGHLSLWSTTDERPLLRLRPSLSPVTNLAVSGGAKLLAASDGEQTWLWNLETGKQVGTFDLGATALGQHQDGMGILAVDRFGAIYRLSNNSNAPEKLERDLFEQAIVQTSRGEVIQVHSAAIAPGPTAVVIANSIGSNDPRYLNVFHDGYWTSTPLPDAYYSIFDLEISPDGRKVLVGEASAFSLYDISDLGNVAHFGLHGSGIDGGQSAMPEGLSSVDTLAFFRDADHLMAIGSEGNPIASFSVATSATSDRFGAKMDLPVFGTSATIAGHKLFHLTGEGHIAVFDLTTGQPATPIPVSALPVHDYEPHGYLFSGTDGNAYYEFYDGPGVRIDPATLRTTRLEPREAAKFASHEENETVLASLKKAGLSGSLDAMDSKPSGVVMISSSSGLMYLLDTESGAKIATVAFFKGEDWAIATELGFFDGTLGGIKALSAVDGLTARPVIEAMPRYHRPDLVRAILTGDPDGIANSEAARLLTEAPATSAPTPDPVVNPVETDLVVIPENLAPTVITETEESVSVKPAAALPVLDLNTETETTESASPEPKAPALPGLSISTEGTD